MWTVIPIQNYIAHHIPMRYGKIFQCHPEVDQRVPQDLEVTDHRQGLLADLDRQLLQLHFIRGQVLAQDLDQDLVQGLVLGLFQGLDQDLVLDLVHDLDQGLVRGLAQDLAQDLVQEADQRRDLDLVVPRYHNCVVSAAQVQ